MGYVLGSAKELYEDSDGEFSINDRLPVIKLKTAFRIQASGNAEVGVDLVRQAIQAGELPNMFAQHPILPLLTVQKINVKREPNTKFNWIVLHDWSSVGPDEEDTEDDPLKKPVMRQTSSVKFKKALDKDINGDPVLNSAKRPFDPPYEVEYPGKKISFERNEPTLDLATELLYEHRINSDPWGPFAVGTVLCDEISTKEVHEKKFHYFTKTYQFIWNPNGWNPEILSQGMMEIASEGTLGSPTPGQVTTKWKRCQVRSGEDVSEPVPLDKDGAMLEPSSLPAGAHYIKPEAFHKADFNALGFNLS